LPRLQASRLAAISDSDRLDDRPTAARILEAAAGLFARKGYGQTSVQDVADAVGILKGSLYYYIDSKEDLLFRLLDDIHQETSQIVKEVEPLEDVPAIDRLGMYVQRHVEFNARNTTKITVYYQDIGLLSPKRRKVILEQRKLYEDFVEGLIEEAQAAGDIDRSLNAKLLTFFVFANINWLYTWYKPRGAIKPDEVAALCSDFVLAGVTGSKATA
jgi:AcrR family transcriptional regulator